MIVDNDFGRLRSGLLRTEPKVSALREPAAIACPSGYTPETWAAKQAEVAEFSRRDPYKDPAGERRTNAEARLRAAMCIQCADVPNQFALVRRGDLITLLGDFTRYRAGFEIWRKERAERTASVDRSPEGEKPQALNATHESAAATAATPTPDHLHHSSTTPGSEEE